MTSAELLAALDPVGEPERTRFDSLLEVAEACLRSTRFAPLLRSFEPSAEATAVLLSSGRDADREADRAAVSTRSRKGHGWRPPTPSRTTRPPTATRTAPCWS